MGMSSESDAGLKASDAAIGEVGTEGEARR
jgi:hypothetical protein